MVAAGQLPVSDEDGRKKKIISLKDIIWVVLSSNPLIDIYRLYCNTKLLFKNSKVPRKLYFFAGTIILDRYVLPCPLGRY